MSRHSQPAKDLPSSVLEYADLAATFDASGRDLLAYVAHLADLPAADVHAVVAAGADRHVVGAHLFELGSALRRFRAASRPSHQDLKHLVKLKADWCGLLATLGRRS